MEPYTPVAYLQTYTEDDTYISVPANVKPVMMIRMEPTKTDDVGRDMIVGRLSLKVPRPQGYVIKPTGNAFMHVAAEFRYTDAEGEPFVEYVTDWATKGLVRPSVTPFFETTKDDSVDGDYIWYKLATYIKYEAWFNTLGTLLLTFPITAYHTPVNFRTAVKISVATTVIGRWEISPRPHTERAPSLAFPDFDLPDWVFVSLNPEET